MAESRTLKFPGWHADPRLPADRPFSVAEARQSGVDNNMLARLVRRGLLRRVVRSVYVDASMPDSIDVRARALGLAVPDEAVVTDATAAWLYGVDVFPPGSYYGPMPRLHYFRPLERTRVRRQQVQGGRRQLEERDLRRIGDLAVTTPLRTACDLGRGLQRGDALGALDALLRTQEFSQAELVAEVQRFRGRRGVVQLRDLVPIADAQAESMRESALRLLWLDAGLPKPSLQLPVGGPAGHAPFRLDLGDPSVKYAAEYDGEDWHSSPEQVARDTWRRNLIRDDGWTIDVFRNSDIHRWSALSRLQDGYRRAAERSKQSLGGPLTEAERVTRAFGHPRYSDEFLAQRGPDEETDRGGFDRTGIADPYEVPRPDQIEDWVDSFDGYDIGNG